MPWRRGFQLILAYGLKRDDFGTMKRSYLSIVMGFVGMMQGFFGVIKEVYIPGSAFEAFRRSGPGVRH